MGSDTMADEPYLYGYKPITGEPIYNVQAFGEAAMDPARIVGRTRLIWKQKRFVLVSTVGLVRIVTDPTPLYETLVGGDTPRLPVPLDTVDFGELGGRYGTFDEAVSGHRRWCQLVSGWLTHAGRHTVTWREMTTW